MSHFSDLIYLNYKDAKKYKIRCYYPSFFSEILSARTNQDHVILMDNNEIIKIF